MSGWRELKLRIKRGLFGTALYDIWLNGRAPTDLGFQPQGGVGGDPAAADRLFQGRWRFLGEEVLEPRGSPWTLDRGSAVWRAELQSCDWLNHFVANGADAARRHARALIGAWLGHFPRWQAEAWRPDLVGRRISAWCRAASFLLDGADADFRQAFFKSLFRQARHLDDAWMMAPAGRPQLQALIGQIHGCLCLEERAARLPKALALLAAELYRQVLADGGHISRNPAVLGHVLTDLVDLKADLIAAHQSVPQGLQDAIDRAGPLLRTLRHGDGGLALFHGGDEGEANQIEDTLLRADSRGKPFHSAPHAGFERLTAKQSVLILDRGLPPSIARGGTPHAAPLAFEFSARKDRLIVNCGAAPRGDGDWSAAMAASAAHSTLILDDRNAIDLDAKLPADPTVARQEADGAIWLDAAHDGYRARFGASHRRRLYLAASGDDLRGEDAVILDADAQTPGHAIALRFHLHPSTTAQPTQGGSEVLIRTGSGKGWRFRAAGGLVAVEDSIYFGLGLEARKTRQIVVTARAEGPETVIKWALTRLKADG